MTHLTKVSEKQSNSFNARKKNFMGSKDLNLAHGPGEGITMLLCCMEEI